MNKTIVVVALMGLFAIGLAAQTIQVPAADRAALARLSTEITSAVLKKDRVALERIYAEDFVHVHAKGNFDDRKRRLDSILSGEPTVDTPERFDLGLRKYGDTIVAVGTVTVKERDGKSVKYSVTRVYVKVAGQWIYASSHATAADDETR